MVVSYVYYYTIINLSYNILLCIITGNGRSAVVKFIHRKDAVEAKSKCDGCDFMGRIIRIEWCRSMYNNMDPINILSSMSISSTRHQAMRSSTTSDKNHNNANNNSTNRKSPHIFEEPVISLHVRFSTVNVR
jgi:ribulose 1,5-bisphosphate synthetase/thiazole synthase